MILLINEMKKIFIIALTLLWTSVLWAQTIHVCDKSTQKGIANVALVDYNGNNSIITDEKGDAPLEGFEDNDTIMFQHTSYQTIVLSIAEIKAMNYTVDLFPSVIQLGETVISANRWEQKKREVPMHIAQIPVRDIHMMEVQTSADMLGNSGQVFIQKSQMGGGSPMIRGFSSNKVLIVVDGVRMNNPIYRHGNLQNVMSVDPNALESSEVVFGPGSVIYGSDAIGGVMDFHTLSLRYSGKDTLRVSGNALLRYNSGNDAKTGHFDFNIGYNNFSSLTSVSSSNFGDLCMGTKGVDGSLLSQFTNDSQVLRINNQDSVVPNSDPYCANPSAYSQVDILQKLGYRFSENLSLEYAFHYSSTNDVPRYDRLVQMKNGDPKYAQWYYGPQKWMMHNLKLEDKRKRFLYDDMKLQLGYQDYEESRHDRKLNDENLRHRTENVKMFTLNMDMFNALSTKHAIYYGFEGSMSKIFSDGYEENLLTNEENAVASRYPNNSDYSTAAVYLSYRYLLNSKWTMNAGTRINAVYAFAPFDSEFYDFPYNKIELTGLAPNAMAGIAWNPDKSSQVNLNLSTGYRAPNIDDIGKVFDSEAGSVVVPNENLNPEYAYNFELNASKTIAGIVRINGGAFYTILTDAMIRDDFTFNGQDSIMYDGQMSQVQAIQNIGRVDVYGVFGGIYADLSKNLSVKSVINWTGGEDQDGNPYRHVAPLFGQTHVLLNFGSWKIDAFAVYNGEISPERLSTEEHEKSYMYVADADYAAAQSLLPEDEQFNPLGLYSPAWMTLNLNVSYSMNRNLVLSAGAENLTDQLYRTYSSGIPAMGRRVFVSLKANF